MTVQALIAYDGSSSADAAVRAAAALFPGAHAVVLHVHDVLDPAAVPDHLAGAAARLGRRAHAGAQELAEQGRRVARASGLQATAEVRGGTSPWREIGGTADELAADVIVCGSGGRGSLSRALLGSVSSSLLHHAERPVLIVPADTSELSGPAVLAYDDSDGARAAIAAAARLLPGRAALVVHASSSPLERSYAGEAAGLVPLADVQELVADLEEMFAASAGEVADAGADIAREAGLRARARAVNASPGTWQAVAAAAAEEGAAVIVAGTRGRGMLAGSVLGSVSAGLAHNAERPVLVVP